MRVEASGAMTFLRPDGRSLPEAPAAPHWDGPPLAPVDRRLAAAGIGIDADTAPRWQGERLDLAWAIDVLWRPRTGADPPASVPVPAETSGPRRPEPEPSSNRRDGRAREGGAAPKTAPTPAAGAAVATWG